jgi:hypothetical protein
MEGTPPTYLHSPPRATPCDGIRAPRRAVRLGFAGAAARAMAIAVASLALGTAAVLGLLFAAVALA